MVTHHHWLAKAEPAPPPPDGVRPELPDGAGPSLEPVQTSWLEALDALLARWSALTDTWSQAVVDAIAARVQAGDIVGLAAIGLDTQEGSAALEAAMMELGRQAGDQVVKEAADQGVDGVHTVAPERQRTAGVAQVIANGIGTYLVYSAVGEALRLWRPGAKALTVADGVAEHLGSLTDAYPRLTLGGALTTAQHDGRVRTIAGGPEAALYSDEILDSNTCTPCRQINRKWLGNSGDAMVLDTYPVQGYVGCLGRQRCRGQVVAVWRGGNDYTKWVELPEQRRGD